MARQWVTSEPFPIPASPATDARAATRLLGLLLLLGVLGALWLGLSLSRGTHGTGVAGVPRTVLVAIEGTPSEPGFTGFLVRINPNREILPVIAVAGTLGGFRGATLNADGSSISAAQLVQSVTRDAGRPLSGYFVMPVTVVQAVFTMLAKNAPNWPRGVTPRAALRALGWHARVRPKTVMRLFNALLNSLPQLESSQAHLQESVVGASQTNLSGLQLWDLGTYVRGVPLRLESWRGYARPGR